MRNLSNAKFSKIKDYHFERLASQVLKLYTFPKYLRLLGL